jgi:broad specificity phosphatase PhoE
MTIEIVFETHSISTDNEAGIATGRLHGELSEEGKRLARRLGERRRGERVDAIYTSDLERAVETAELATGRQWLGCAPFSTMSPPSKTLDG